MYRVSTYYRYETSHVERINNLFRRGPQLNDASLGSSAAAAAETAVAV